MPELPEVETIRKTLEQLVIGKTIKEVIVRYPKIIKRPDDVERFKQALANQTIRAIGRRGKFLKFICDDLVLVSHLRMEGKYRVCMCDEEVDQHTHVLFTFTDGLQMRYRDVRKFGTMHVFKAGEEEKELPLKQLGLEPFGDDFSIDYLYEHLQKTKRKIKPTLLDQTIVVGLGNIYVDEALFHARIHPERGSDTLTKKEVAHLHEAIIYTLKEAVKQGGSTIRTYVNSQGQMGMFQVQLCVYGKNGEPCKTCGTTIEKMTLGGRGTHFCPHCQK